MAEQDALPFERRSALWEQVDQQMDGFKGSYTKEGEYIPYGSIDTPAKLWGFAKKYFAYVDSNPVLSAVVGKQGLSFGRTAYEPRATPYSLSGFCVFLGRTNHSFSAMRKKWDAAGRQDMLHCLGIIKDLITVNNFDGAAAGIFNAHIIAKITELPDITKIVTDDGKGGNAPLHNMPMVVDDMVNTVEKLMKRQEGDKLLHDTD